MTNGQRVALVACELADPPGLIYEHGGPNTDGGGWIDDCQAYWGMGRGTNIGAQPWCGMGQDKIFRLADVDDSGISHPATAEICRRADRMGGLRPKSALIYPGTHLVLCGTHTTTVVHDRGNGLLDCVGCNEDDRLKRSVRSKTWGRLIEVPGLREGEAELNLMEYWFEDPRHDPEFHGRIITRQRRDSAIKVRFAEEDAAGLVRRVKDDGQFGFWVYSGEEWKWGPWIGVKDGKVKKNRDKEQAKLERTLNTELRARSKPVAGVAPDFSGSGGPQDTKTT